MQRFNRGRANNGRNRRNNGRGFFRRRRGNLIRGGKRGPADCTVKELEQHYFDCSGTNEADRFVNTKRAIVQYMGRKYGGDIRVTLETGERFKVPEPVDPASKYTDKKDKNDVVVKTAREQMTELESREYEKMISEYVKRKGTLQTNMEKAFSLIHGQCTYALQQKLESNK